MVFDGNPIQPDNQILPRLYGIPVRVSDIAFQVAVNTPYQRTLKQRLLEGIFTKQWRPRQKTGYTTSWVPDGKIMHCDPPGGPEYLAMHSETLKRILAAIEADRVKKP